MTPFRNIIIEGVDRLGKGTLIEGLLQQLGYFEVIHYQKPKVLESLVHDIMTLSSQEEFTNQALKRYQIASFTQMFRMLSSDGRFILDRAHLGETVYAPRYRGYDGSYVFELEKHFKNIGSDFTESTLLILLHTSDWSFIKDDGLSFDFEKKDEEQNDFIRAFERSEITHKLLLDVHDGAGKFVGSKTLLDTVTSTFHQIKSYNHTLLNVTWRPTFYTPMEYTIERVAEQQIDPKKIVTI